MSNSMNQNQQHSTGKTTINTSRAQKLDELSMKVGSAQQNGLKDKIDKPEVSSNVKVSDIIGDFGPYQIAVVIFAALRALSCAMDGLSGPFLSPSVKNFHCEVCDISQSYNGTSDKVCSLYFGDTVKRRYDLDLNQCYFDNADSSINDRIYCNKWSFNTAENRGLMNSLTIEQSLVCDREWLKSLSNSMYFVGATFGLLFWGIISDRYGRKTAYVCSHFVCLIFGFSALFANSMCSFILLRSINAFGMIGELIPRSIQVEIVATEYRFICSIICQVGWATGIILVPVLSYINPSYRFILAFPVVVSLLMLPWLIWLPESARWLIANQNYEKARNELRRAARINSRLTDDIDLKIEQYNRQVLREEVDSSGGTTGKRLGVWRSIMAIFTNIHLLKDTMSVFTLLFVAEVVYFSLTLNVADLGGSLYINYIISGLSELVSIAFCAVLLAYLSRRMCLSLLLLASTVSYLLMALVNIYEESLSMTVILTVNAFGKLTAIGNLMVIILVSQEVFPTVIRQFGTSLCITVGKAGSAVAPFTHELGQIIGQSYCFGMFSLICLSCAVVPFVLSETGNRELPDTVNDLEEGAARDRDRRKKISVIKSAGTGKHLAKYDSNNSTIANIRHSNGFNYPLTDDIKLNNRNNLNLTLIAPLDQVNQKKKQQFLEDDMNNNNNNNDTTLPDSNSIYIENSTGQQGLNHSNHVNSNLRRTDQQQNSNLDTNIIHRNSGGSTSDINNDVD